MSAEAAADAPIVELPRAAEPTLPVGAGWIARFGLAWVGLFVGLYGAIQVLLPRQAALFTPGAKEGSLALVLGVGAAFSLVANPLFGALSDRTVSRFGRRVPWVVAGTAGGAIGLVVLAFAPSIVVVLIGWCVVQTMLNAAYAALSAVIPDEVPIRQRGSAAGYSGLSLILGIGLGTGLAVASGDVAIGYLGCAAFLLLSVVPFVLSRRAVPPDAIVVAPFRWGAFVRGLWVDPRRHPDFGWAWLTRFLVNLGNAIALLYLYYFLSDVVRVADPGGAVLLATAVNLTCLLLSVVVAGVWSDRVGKRRIFVCCGALLMAAAALLLAGWGTWPGVLVSAALLGLGYGAYTAVDLALLTQVLPDAAARAKDLGLLNVAASLPQVVAPVVAAPIVFHLGGYPTLYVVGAVVGGAGAVLVYRIKGVR